MKKSIFTLLIANITLVGFGQNQKIHTVGPKETFYSIARLYDIPPKELMKVNPKYAPDYKLNPTDRLIIHTDQTEVENQLKNLAEVAPPIQNQNQTSTHTVAKGQTLYSLARLYNIDAKELMRLNPKYGPTYSLKVKDVISLTANTSQMMPTAQKEEQLEVKKEVKNTAEIKTENAIHKVEQGQTLYSIARMYDIHPKELMALNPSFGPKYSLKVNDKIAIVSSDKLSSVEQTSSVEATKTKERRGKTAAIPKDNSSTSLHQTHGIIVAKIHYSKEGQTLSSISTLYKISISDLMRINNITNSNQKFNEGDKVYLSENVSELSAVEKQNQDIIAAVVYKPLNDSTLIPASYFKGNGKEITLVKSNPAEKSFLKLIEYQVQKKETLLDIGNRYGILITKIMELNRMQTVKLKPGQRIFIDTEWINPQRAKANTPTSPTADL